MNSDQPKKPKGWRESLASIFVVLFLLALRSASTTDWKKFVAEHGGWSHVLSWVALWVSTVLGSTVALWFLWRLFKPMVMTVRDQGIVGCLRWVRQRLIVPLLYGRRGKP